MAVVTRIAPGHRAGRLSLVTAITDSALALRVRRARHTALVVRKVSALNFRAQLEYRGNFVVSIIFGIVWQTSTLMFASVLLTRFKGGLGSFPSAGVMLIIGMRLMAHGLYVLWFSTLAWLPTLVDEGRIDGYFLRPIPVLTQLLLSEFNVNALGDLLVGGSALGVALTLVHVHWTIPIVLYLALAVIAGGLVEGAVQLMLACLLLRSPGSRVLGSWIDELMSTFGNYPLSILPKAVQGLFTFLLPLAFVAYFPAGRQSARSRFGAGGDFQRRTRIVSKPVRGRFHTKEARGG